MNNIPSHISWRYLTHKQKDSNIAFMIKVCFLGILIGSFSLMLTLIITNGFEKETHDKMRGINADITMYSPGNKLDFDSIKNVIEKDFKGNVKGVSAHSFKQVILNDKKNRDVLFLKGIDPKTESLVSHLAEKIVLPLKANGDNLLEIMLGPDQVLIGHKTALEHTIAVGDEIQLLLPEAAGRRRMSLSDHNVTVTGIFNVGLDEYDNNIAFISLQSLNEMFEEEGADQIVLSLYEREKPDDTKKSQSFIAKWFRDLKRLIKRIGSVFSTYDHHEDMTARLKKRFPKITAQSWKEQYPALVSSLKLEKYVMFFIIALISLVACMNMISLLFMQIQQKRKDIAIFKAMGIPHAQIQSIFLRMGLTITLSAAACGLGLAALAGYLLETYPFIQLPDVYFVSHLPARIDFDIFVVVFFVTLILGFIATWIPAKRSASINISQVLRQE